MSVESEVSNSPFFIVGCVRSGTTLLRNILRLHPRLESPEETHFFRRADPFGTAEYEALYSRAKLFKKHRQLDGIADFDFHYSLQQQPTRKGLMDWYGQRLLEVRGNPNGRWFDKTPQHVYGLLMLAEAYPEAKFVHIYRNPLNVVASLLRGEVLPKQSVRAAVNYWLEAAMILSQYKRLAPDRVIEIQYEQLLRKPKPTVTALLQFLGESDEKFPFRKVGGLLPGETKVDKKKLKDSYLEVLSKQQVSDIKQATEPYFSRYGYR